MRKNSIPAKVSALIGLMAIPAIFSGLTNAAPAFVPSSAPIVGYVAQPDLTNFNLKSGAESVFRGEYSNGSWSGNLSCYPVTANGAANVAAPCWGATASGVVPARTNAQFKVDAQGFASGSRNIATVSAVTGMPAAFALAADPVNLLDANHVNFIRGDRSQEAGATPSVGTLRTRNSALGDVIHSRPFYLADTTYPTVFYGGNDGMLHAIDATQSTGGKERWAYIPSMLLPNLKNLWASPYVHDDYVDGNVNVINAGTAVTPQNILVGVLGAGGKGIYALDVTNLNAFSDADVANKFLWEITPTSITTRSGRAPSTAYANLGDTYSNPTLYPVLIGGAKVNAVIVGNGYNNAGNGHATLLVIDVKTGTKLAEIDTGVAGSGGPNGLSTPAAVDSNGDGAVDIVYAGDIDGNMWKFDLSNASTTFWTAKLLYSTKQNTATPLGQAITMMPGVGIHPSGGYMVNFATGRILTDGSQAGTTDDTKDTSIFYAYGIWDGAPAANVSAKTLVTQTISVRKYTPSPGATPVTVRVVGATPASTAITPNWNPGGDIGWKAALPVGGERVTGDSAFDQYGRFFFNATNPTVAYTYTPAGTNVAISGKGENWLMELDYLTGGGPNTPFFDMNSDGLVNSADRVQYVAGDTIPAPSVVGDPIPTNFGIPVGLFTSNGVQSQPALGGVGNFSAMFFNQNWNLPGTSVTTQQKPGNTTGIGGGHFDADMFWNQGRAPAYSWKETDHKHEYDKQYDVNGVNFLNPNDRTEGLWNAIDPATGAKMTPTTPYKVLLMNQSWNRAVMLTLGTNIFSSKDYQTGPDKVTNLGNASGSYNVGVTWASLRLPGATGVGALKMSSLPTFTGTTSTVVQTAGVGYTLAPTTQAAAPAPVVPKFGLVTVNQVTTTGSIGCGGFLNGVAINTGCTTTKVTTDVRGHTDTSTNKYVGVGGFELSMPNTAFQQLDWWGDGVIQTGVMPTHPSCPDASNADGTDAPYVAGSGAQKQFSGKLGERNDGIITVQVVKDTTPDSAVQMNVPGRPDLGFRVIDGVATFQKYVMAEYIIYWHHPLAVCYGDDKTAWKLANNDGDPWWPAQETGNLPDTQGSGVLGSDIAAKDPYTATIKCGPQNSSSNPAWVATAPPASWTTLVGSVPATAWTTPPGWPPYGFTITPPLDTATTLPLCPSYSTLYDDPRTASFVTSSAGTGGGGSTPTSGTTTTTDNNPPNLIGGAATVTPVNCGGAGQPACATTCGGAGQPACPTNCGGANQPACPCGTPGGAATCPCGTAGNPCNQTPKQATTGRVSWHELIRQ